MHLWVIVGATATGKTALAAALAHHLGADIISADSRQVYRGLDLGTGKDLHEFQKFNPPIRTHLIDIVDPDQVYSLYQYQQACYQVIHEIHDSKNVVMVGGTGMYIEAVLRRYSIANVPENAPLRESLSSRSLESLIQELKTLSPELANRTDLSSRKRVVRAHIIYHAGLIAEVDYSPPPPTEFSYKVFGIAWERKKLRERINNRLAERIKAGMIEEVEGLLKQGVTSERLQLLGMEYREIADYITGLKSREQMLHDLAHEIHLLAKRQETYFRGFARRGVAIEWLQSESAYDTLIQS